MRKSFSMLTAIIFMVTVAILLSIALSNITTSTKETTDIYSYEQARLLARSGTEFAIMAIQGHDFSTNCVNNININYQNTYDINATIYYIGSGLPPTCNKLADPIATAESNATVIIDICVSLKKDLDNTPIRYCRRTLQKL